MQRRESDCVAQNEELEMHDVSPWFSAQAVTVAGRASKQALWDPSTRMLTRCVWGGPRHSFLQSFSGISSSQVGLRRNGEGHKLQSQGI